MNIMTILYWVLAFIGVALICGGGKLLRLIKKDDVSEKTENLIKTVGVLLSAAALVMLYISGSFK